MERPIVSIIIPVYNVEDYIEKAVESICAQSLTDWEMFLIDDGSTDGSGDKCDKLAENDPRITVIHQENQGAAAARNVGIEKAGGKYLYFMDGDDWAVNTMLYEMVCMAENYSMDAWAGKPMDNTKRDMGFLGNAFLNPQEFIADMPENRCAQLVITGYYIETYYGEMEYYIQKQAVTPRVFASKSEFREKAHELFDRNLLYTPWNKLYLTSFIKENEIRFPSVHWDDFPFNLEVIKKAEKVTVSDKAFYHFIRKRANSESEKYNPMLFEKREEENQWLLDLYQGWKCEVQQAMIEEIKKNQPLIENQDNTAEELKEEVVSEAVTEETVKTDNPDMPLDGEAVEITPEENGESQEVSFNFLDKDSESVPVVNIPSPAATEFISRRYIERVVGCIENVTNPECYLDKAAKIDEIKNIINKDSVREALKTAKPKSLYMKIMLLPIKMKSAKLSYLEGTLISKVKKQNTKLFAKLKANR